MKKKKLRKLLEDTRNERDRLVTKYRWTQLCVDIGEHSIVRISLEDVANISPYLPDKKTIIDTTAITCIGARTIKVYIDPPQGGFQRFIRAELATSKHD